MLIKKFLTAFVCILLLSAPAFGQGSRISGTVVDEHGEPVIGASVMIKGSKTGTVTDVDGKFSVSTTA
ncbi:MAG: carboxypeptidase-like regulatory domain-containing protein, partial [Oscillospiraceae bacterium]|nr:carboxypeptidase-like regulatory domain-containing protein [Oscillospiraceae bacterium]MBO5049504.1 carboxypeptidase-like regulatory domain-containing protein [Oscillospiraceae bacterium]